MRPHKDGNASKHSVEGNGCVFTTIRRKGPEHLKLPHAATEKLELARKGGIWQCGAGRFAL